MNFTYIFFNFGRIHSWALETYCGSRTPRTKIVTDTVCLKVVLRVKAKANLIVWSSQVFINALCWALKSEHVLRKKRDRPWLYNVYDRSKPWHTESIPRISLRSKCYFFSQTTSFPRLKLFCKREYVSLFQ